MSAPRTSFIENLGRWSLRRLGATSVWHESGGTRLHAFLVPRHARAPRDAPPLVLLHGVGSSASTFGRLLRRLRPHFGDIYLPEAPAHGHSSVPPPPMTPNTLFELVRGWLDEVPPAPFVLYGNSLGGAASLRYAIERPERVRALCLLSPAGAGTPPEELSELVASFDLESPGAARRFMGRLFRRPRWYHHLAAGELRRRFAQPPLQQFFAEVGTSDTLDPAAVARLPMPVLLMWGGSERLLPESNRAWFRQHLPPGATLSEPEHFAHSAYIEHPTDVAQEILAFLRARAVLPPADPRDEPAPT
ncbi:MAG: alpha/beta hydrolase [Myxococcota bacterium]